MNFLKKLELEHEEIERELIELETIIEDSNIKINYSNLIFVLKKLFKIWDLHEEKEEKIFLKFKKEKILLPIKKMTFEHKSLKKLKDKIKKSLNSGSEFEIKKILIKDLKEVIAKLREHINDEENSLFVIPLQDIFSVDEIMELNKIANS